MLISRSTARSARRLGLAMIAGAIALAGSVPAAQADLRVEKNQRLTADSSPFRGKDQVALAVNPNNPQHIVATNSDYLNEACEASASFDGGATWNEAFSLQPPAPGIGAPFLPTCRVSDHAGESMFQGVVFGSGQNVYATSITPRAASGVEQGASGLVYRSTDGGVTWGRGVVSLPGGTGGTIASGPYYELPSVVVDPGAGPGQADIVYSVARDASGSGNTAAPCPAATRCDAVRVARSTDGGQTFGAPVQASPPGVRTIDAASPVIGPNGSLNITWRTVGATAEIQFVRSTTQGQTWSPPVTVAGVTNVARPTSSHVTPVPNTASTFQRLAANRQNGNLYIVYNQRPPGPTAPPGGYAPADHFIPPDSHVYFQRSLNNGTSWSAPKLINDNTIHPGTQIIQTRHPSVSVAPNGRVDIVWEDRRHWYQGPGERTCLHTHLFCDDARLGDTYYSFSTDSGATFSANRRISDHSHNNDTGYDYRFATYWAFGPVSVPLGSDSLLVGWMDSREGSYDTDNQDIYLAKVRHDAPADVPQERIDQPDNVALSVALSKRTYMGGGEGLLLSTFASRRGTRVVIANENDVPGALAGGVLARANMGPVLLSPAGGLPESVKAEVARLSPAGAYVIGDTGQLSEQVVADLAAAGVGGADIVRVSGSGDEGTAAAIAAQFDRRTAAERAGSAPAFDAAVIANPASPDAVAASALAAARRLPILYVNQNAVPAATAAALTSLNINRTLVIGDAGTVSNGVMSGLPGTAKRLGGSDVYGTSREVAAESVLRGLPSNVVYVAGGTRPMDAALLGFAVGRSTGIMVLAPGSPSDTATATANAAGLTGIDRLVVVEPTPRAQPAQTDPPAQPGQPAQPGAGSLSTAKLSLARATIDRRARVLDVFAPITTLASGRVNVELHAAGRRYRFTAAIDSRRGRIRFRRRIPAAQARLGTGILTIAYRGDADTRPQTVRLRAANRPAVLRLARPTIASNGRLRASGTVSARARGVVRVQLEYVADGRTRTRQFTARINNGRWSLNQALSQAVRDEIARRSGTVHSYTLFTGYHAARMRGEMRSFQVLGAR